MARSLAPWANEWQCLPLAAFGCLRLPAVRFRWGSSLESLRFHAVVAARDPTRLGEFVRTPFGPSYAPASTASCTAGCTLVF